MTPGEKALLALFIVSSVSGELSVLVTGMPHHELNPDFEMTNGKPVERAMVLSKKESWESFEDSKFGDEGEETRAEYQRLLGIDPLANSFLNEMNINEGEDKHMVRKRVLPYSEEISLSPDALDLMDTKEKDRR